MFLAITCAQPSSISNGQYTGSDFTYGGVIQYICDDRYGMVGGDAVHTCRSIYSSIGYWDGSVISCVGELFCIHYMYQNYIQIYNV